MRIKDFLFANVSESLQWLVFDLVFSPRKNREEASLSQDSKVVNSMWRTNDQHERKDEIINYFMILGMESVLNTSHVTILSV